MATPFASSRARHVVTAVVRRSTDSSLLLLRRCDRVSTYKLHWHFVSGSMEPEDDGDALKSAWREIAEEVQLRTPLLRFERRARPLRVSDGALEFIVHPVLFSASDAAEPVLNWENMEFRWASQKSLASLSPLVPRLQDTLDRALCSNLGSQQLRLLEEIKRNRTSGASELSLQAAQALLQCSAPKDPEQLLDFAFQLAYARPSMAAIANCITEVLERADVHDSDVDGLPARLSESVQAIIDTSKNEMEILCTIASNELQERAKRLQRPLRILTCSISSTIRRTLLQCSRSKVPLSLFITESRPLNEGVSLAKILASESIDCTLLTDAQAYSFMPQVDLVLLGADMVTRDGNLVNKVGSYALALGAKQFGLDCIALTDSRKCQPFVGSKEIEMEEMSSEEVASGLDAFGIKVRNIYFEKVPLRLFSKIITESGEFNSEHILRVCEMNRIRFDDVFIE